MTAAASRLDWRIGRLLMIIAPLTYGPLASLIDTLDPFHLTNAEWNGHARFHLLWLICACSYFGFAATYLAWRATPQRFYDLRASAGICVLLMGAFFTAGALKNLVGGSFGPQEHFLGPVPIPLLHFSTSTAMMASGYFLCRRAVRALGLGTAAPPVALPAGDHP